MERTQAELAARQLIVNYPEAHDGYDRLGMVYEARKQPKRAADCYRNVIEFMQARPTDYDAELLAEFTQLIQELDPPAPRGSYSLAPPARRSR